MIDPSITDLMDHLDRPPPAFVQEADRGRLRQPYQAEKTRRSVEAVEAWADEWIAEGERQIAAVIADSQAGSLTAEDIKTLNVLADTMQSGMHEAATIFQRDQKRMRRYLKVIRAASAADGKLVAGLVRRFLTAEAKRGLARADFMFAIRAVVAEADPASRTGPVFDDPKALGDYLRAAIA